MVNNIQSQELYKQSRYRVYNFWIIKQQNMSFNTPNQEAITPFETTKTSFDARTHQFHKYSTTIVHQNQDHEKQNVPQPEDQESLENKRKKSFSPIKSFKIMQNMKKPVEEPFQAHPVMISSFTPEESQSPKPLVNPKNSITYLLQHQTSRNPSLSNKRSEEQIDLIMKLIVGNKIWKDLGYEDSTSNSARVNQGANFNQMLREICNSIVLSWSEIPNITETKPNEIYLILEGKTFEYIHNENAAIKLKIHQNNDYIMIRKLIENDYFMTLAPQIRAKNKSIQNSAEKYQLMVDEKTLMGKISDELFVKWIQKRLYERTRNLTSFMKKIVLFENLPDVVFHELSKFISEKKIGPDTEIINANEKSKDIYFIKRGEVEFKLLATKVDSEKNEDTKKQILRDYDVFGMDTLHTVKGADIMVQYSAQSLTECELYYIDKRILAIVISSFENQFKLQGKVIKSIDINSQIKGQNYLSVKQQILSRNAQRIKTSQRRIRDVKLQSFSRKKSRQINTYIPQKDRINERKMESKSYEARLRSSGGFNLLRNKSMRSQGSLINPKGSTDSMFWNLKNKFESKYENKQFEGQQGGICNNYVLPVMQQGQVGLKKSPTMRSNSTLVEFERINHIQKEMFIRSQRGKSMGSPANESAMNQFGQTSRSPFIPRVQSKSTFFEHSAASGKIQSEIIKNHIQKKIKNQLIKKAQQVLERKTSIQRNSIKNIKKFYQVQSFSPTKVPEATPPQKMTRKQLTDDLLERMANIKNYPLLSLIESERKKMESLSKVKSKQLKQVQQKREQQKKDKKYKVNEKKILILDISSLPDQNHGSEPLNRFSSAGSRILSEQT